MPLKDGEVTNHLLQLLAARPVNPLSRKLKLENLHLGRVLSGHGEPSTDFYFPTGGVISAMVRMSDGTRMEIRAIGREGVLGTDGVYGLHHGRFELVCQVAGPVLRVPSKAFHAEMARSAYLRTLLQRYSYGVFSFMAQSIACNGLHSIAQRCARWLLVTRDRVGGNEFRLTHHALAIMLGVRRSGVTVAVQALQNAGAIQYNRGIIRILNARELERKSCECYATVVHETKRLLAG